MKSVDPTDLKSLLDEKVDEYMRPEFIESDPISVPHSYSKKQDIEIAGLFAATFAWGNRTTIINKTLELMERMDDAPHDFVLHHSDQDLKKLVGFKHRTFMDTDLLYFIDFLHRHYSKHASLEVAFIAGMSEGDSDAGNGLAYYHEYFFNSEHAPQRTRKHVATPIRGSSCKRLNMFLRWMVRKSDSGVDFGIWKRIKASQLLCPLDLHVHRVATRLGLLQRKQSDWKATIELTENLRQFDPDDPVKYDYALFGMGVMEKL